MALRDPRDYWYLLITPIWLVHSVVKNFHFGISAFADPKNIPMSQEVQRKRKEPTKRRTIKRFPIVVPKTDSGEPNVVSRQCLYQKPEEPRNLRAAKIFDCAKLNEALKVAEKAPRTSLLMKTSPNTGQGKKPQPRAEKVLRFSSTE